MAALRLLAFLAPWAALLGGLFILTLWMVPRAHASAPGAMCGGASWYGYTGRRTANGEPFDGRSMTAASRTLPFGTRVRVTDQATGASIVVRINDRGPFVHGRIIDLSSAAADRLGSKGRGVVPVCLTPLQ